MVSSADFHIADYFTGSQLHWAAMDQIVVHLRLVTLHCLASKPFYPTYKSAEWVRTWVQVRVIHERRPKEEAAPPKLLRIIWEEVRWGRPLRKLGIHCAAVSLVVSKGAPVYLSSLLDIGSSNKVLKCPQSYTLERTSEWREIWSWVDRRFFHFEVKGSLVTKARAK